MVRRSLPPGTHCENPNCCEPKILDEDERAAPAVCSFCEHFLWSVPLG